LSAPALTLAGLRRKTLTRASSMYWHWVERSVGWGTLIWMIGWLVFYAIAASQVVIFNVTATSSAAVPFVLLALTVVALNYLVVTRRTPPVILGRQDLYRLGLAPLTPLGVLSWGFTYSRLVLFAVGVIAGLVWWLFAFAFFRLEPIFAPVALGLWFATLVDWGWLRYVGSSRIGVFTALTVGGALVELLLGVGVSSALWNANPLGLIVPGVALALGIAWSRATLQEAYPPRFASHSLIMSQLRAMNLTAVMVQRPPDPDVRRRLLRTLHQGSPAIRPDRFLPIPRVEGAFGVIAWRVALTLYRRGMLEQLGLLAQVAFFVFIGSGVVQGVIGTLLLIFALSGLTPRLLGPSFNPLPVDPPTRTLGRTLPGMILIVGIALLAFVSSLAFPSVTVQIVIAGMLHALLSIVMLEKLSHRFAVPASSRDVALGAAVFAVLPEITLGILGMPSSLLPVQVGLLVLLLWQPFL
jgi:hypothetical protein